MRVLPTKIHGAIDYIVSFFLMASPWLFDFGTGAAETLTIVIAGVIAFIYSFCTNYELGIIKVISMDTHLMLDAGLGLFLIASPWIFGFYSQVYLPHMIFGVFAIVASLISKKIPYSLTLMN